MSLLLGGVSLCFSYIIFFDSNFLLCPRFILIQIDYCEIYTMK